ncbi:Peptidyl-tRNA hydrolase [Methyloligella halotolerans]|uniref:Peptidyl-tRNA hydrolase n=1 Tax=Methyloligella halotolerans TaxID=1177755 RepID=A0A1E2RXK5_9HYPH|nr:aminoacyl-tRNA hydrolase [Methyloligella halotolerans]ODA66954.1 Peptidyl-tRNA hydrolase [Methyloligella halotolerans]
MKLLVGLGNPGAQYAFNRHNVGFMAVDAIHGAENFAAWRKRFHGYTAEGELDGEKILLLKPETYMNESGRAVGEAVRFFKIPVSDVIVFHDELDLAPEKVRVKTGGGVAGHNGLKSITSHIGNDYVRVRIGIGHPGSKERVHGHVMGDFAKADHGWLVDELAAIADAAPFLVEGAYDKFQTAVAHWKNGNSPADEAPAKPEKAAKPATPKPSSAPPTQDKTETSLGAKLKAWLDKD